MNKNTSTWIIIALASLLIGLLFWYIISLKISNTNRDINISNIKQNKDVPLSQEKIDNSAKNDQKQQGTGEILYTKVKSNTNLSVKDEESAQSYILTTLTNNTWSLLSETLDVLVNNEKVSNKSYYFSLVYYYLSFAYEMAPSHRDNISIKMEEVLKKINSYEDNSNYKTLLKEYTSHMIEMSNGLPKINTLAEDAPSSWEKTPTWEVKTKGIVFYQDEALSIPEFQKWIEENLKVNLSDYKNLYLKIKSWKCDDIKPYNFNESKPFFNFFNLEQNWNFFCNVRKLVIPWTKLKLEWDDKENLNYIKLLK